MIPSDKEKGEFTPSTAVVAVMPPSRIGRSPVVEDPGWVILISDGEDRDLSDDSVTVYQMEGFKGCSFCSCDSHHCLAHALVNAIWYAVGYFADKRSRFKPQ